MANYYVNTNLELHWQEFTTDYVDYVRLYYKIGEAEAVFISNLDNSYETAVDANADGNNRHSYNLLLSEEMIGTDVTFIVRDGTEDDIEVVASGPHDIFSTQTAIAGTTFTILWSNILSSTVDLRYSEDNGNTWTDIELNASYTAGPEFGQGSYDWLVPFDLNGPILVSAYDVDVPDRGMEQLVYVVSAEIATGSVWRLQWSDFVSDTVRIEYQIEGGNWNLIIEDAPNHNGSEFGQGYYDWTVSVDPCDFLLIRITDVENNESITSPGVTIVESTSEVTTAEITSTFDPITTSISGTSVVQSSLTSSFDPITTSIQATVIVGGSVSSSFSDITTSIQSQIVITGGISSSFDDIATSISGIVDNVTPAVECEITSSFDSITTNITGYIRVEASITSSFSAISTSIEGSVVVNSEVSSSFDPIQTSIYAGNALSDPELQIILDRVMELTSTLNTVVSELNALSVVVGTMLTEERFKGLTFNRHNIIENDRITEYTAGGNVTVAVELDEKSRPVRETIVE